MIDDRDFFNHFRQKPNEEHKKSDARALYEVAMQAGYAGVSCKDAYHTCPYTSQQIMAVIRAVGDDLSTSQHLQRENIQEQVSQEQEIREPLQDEHQKQVSQEED